MHDEAESILISKCLRKIEEKLGWGNGLDWATHDFEVLSETILKETGVRLSIITLKRIWGKIKYENRPTATTLNTLVQYLGHQNWRTFQQQHASSVEERKSNKRTNYLVQPFSRHALIWGFTSFFIIAGILIIFIASNHSGIQTSLDPALYKFESHKLVSEGVPNSVIFEYDASMAGKADSIFIQQSWDRSLRDRVPLDKNIHTSIYYYPGFFKAKLVINDSIVKEHDIIIKSQGWLPVVERNPVPLYFSFEAASGIPGILKLPVEKIKENAINLQPNTPWVAYYNIGQFKNLNTDAFEFETTFKNDFGEGTAVCQHSEIHLILKGGVMIFPFSIKGCVSELSIFDMGGVRDVDLSGFGCDFNDWVNFKLIVKDGTGYAYVNDQFIIALNYQFPTKEVLGIKYRFQGTGSVKSLMFRNNENNVVFQEDFQTNS